MEVQVLLGAQFMSEEKKPVKREYSAGGVVYRKDGDETLWLVIQPEGDEHWSHDRWQFPKGMIEPGEKATQTALREVEEETGVIASLQEKIDSIRIFFYDEEKNRIFKTITFYLMEYSKEGKRVEDGEKMGQIVWLKEEDALSKLTYKTEKEMLIKARAILDANHRQISLL